MAFKKTSTMKPTKKAPPPPVKDSDVKVPPPPKKSKGHVGKNITVKVGQAEFKGLCTSERDTNSGGQVYLKLNGCVSRFFNTADITEVE